MRNKNRFTLRLSEEQLEILQETARIEKRSVAAVIRNLIDDIKEKNEVRKASFRNGGDGSIPKPNGNRI